MGNAEKITWIDKLREKFRRGDGKQVTYVEWVNNPEGRGKKKKK